MSAAADLERFLGDPGEPDSPASFRSLVAADEREEQPGAVVDSLREWGFPDFLVPADAGGRLRSIDELYSLWRVLARRDLSLAVSYGATFLGALPVWCWGDDHQRTRVATLIQQGGFGAFGLSERDHGSDLLASDLVAESDGARGYLVSGTKWPIGNATRGRFATLFARTGSGPRGFSMLLLDKAAAPTDRWWPESRVPTMGLRGIDLSGLTLDRCPLPPDALVGRRGKGLDQALQTLQITRTLVTAMSLGAADTALRVALRHACGRKLYGGTVFDLPVIRDQLVCAYVDLLVAECVALASVRAITAAPDRLGLWSAITKHVVPALAEEIITALGGVLGARHFLRDGVADGVFQKLMRDHAIVGVFDGTSHVNLAAVAGQLPSILAADSAQHDASHLFAVAETGRRWQPRSAGLRLTSGGVDEIAQSWDTAAARVRKRCANAELGVAVARVDALWRAHRAAVRDAVARDGSLVGSVLGTELARRHCLLHAATCCVHTWLAGHTAGPKVATEWLPLGLNRIIGRLEPGAPRAAGAATAAVERAMLRCLTENSLFSLDPLPLAG